MQRSLLLLLFLGLALAACSEPSGPDDTNPPAPNTVAVTQLTDLPMAGGDVTGIAISGDNKVVAAIDGRLYSMSMSGGTMEAISDDPAHIAMGLAPSGELYAITPTEIRTYDLATRTHRTVPIDPAGPLAINRRVEFAEIIFSPSGVPYIRMINNTPQTYVYYSTDKGATWKDVTLASGFRYGGGLTFAPNGDMLMASPFGFYRSSDNGATWTTGPAPEPNYGVELLATSNGDIYSYVLGGGGLKVSRDGGASFSSLATFNTAPFFSYMKQGADGALYALAGRSGGGYDLIARPTSFLRSTDGGATWKHVMYAQSRVFAMKGSSIVIGLGANGFAPNKTHGGILISQDNGGTWVPRGMKPVEVIVDVGFDRDGAMMIMADNGLFRRTATGWQALGTQPGNFARFAAAQGRLLIANTTSVYLSTDNGATWVENLVQDYSPGIDAAGVWALIGRSNGDFLMAITSYSDERGYSNGHLYRIGADGVATRLRNITQAFSGIVQDVNGVLYGSTSTVDPFSHTFVGQGYTSSDGGATWTELTRTTRVGMAFNSRNKYIRATGATDFELGTVGSDQATALKLDGFTSQSNYITRAAFGPDDRLYILTRDKGMFISNAAVK